MVMITGDVVTEARRAYLVAWDYDAAGGDEGMRTALEAVLPGLVATAVHEAYVNAQRAVAAIEWSTQSKEYRLGQEHMQEDAVRAIRTAAEEAGNG